MKIGDELGGYELLEVIGRGGFGTVYLGRDADGALGAVKVLHHHYADSPQFRARFRAEVENSMKVSEFCIARVLDADPEGSPPWVVTEYVEGPTLRQTVQDPGPDGGPRSEGDLYRIAVSTATALTAIHASGVVHRDFTPSNIMVTPDGIRVIDFGIARALENSPVSASALLGTPKYMAPEQFLGTQVSPAIDVFAWGSVIAFAGTGRDAFAGENLAVTLRKVLFEKPDLSGLPDSLGAIVRWCLYKDPEVRPSANQLLASLLGVEEPGHEGAVRGISGQGIAGQGISGDSGTVDWSDGLDGLGGTGITASTGGPDGTGAGPYGTGSDGPDAKTDLLAMGVRVGQGSGPIDLSGLPTFAHTPTDRDELFLIGGESYSNANALAKGMQRDWEKAHALLRNAPLRQDLLRWLPEEEEQARRIVEQLPEDWGGADVQAAQLIAELRPELPPLFRDLDLSWGALFGTRAGRAWPYRGTDHQRLIHLVTRRNLLDPFSRHDCVQSNHDCRPGQGCGHYKRVARQTAVMFEYLRKCEAWLRQIGRDLDIGPSEISPDTKGDMVHTLATHALAGSEAAAELADWAAEGVREDRVREQVRRVVLDAEEPWPAAVAVRAYAGDFRELAERLAELDRYVDDQPETEQVEAERERLTKKLEQLKHRDPKLLVWMAYGVAGVLAVLAVVFGFLYWDDLALLAVVLGVAGVLFGGIGVALARDHERSLGLARQRLAELPEEREAPTGGSTSDLGPEETVERVGSQLSDFPG